MMLCDPMECSVPGFPVLHYLLEFAQTHAHWVSDVTQSSHPLSPPSPLALNLSQHQGLFQWVCSSYQVAKLLELQSQHQSFQWIFRANLFDFFVVQRTLKSLFQYHNSKASFFFTYLETFISTGLRLLKIKVLLSWNLISVPVSGPLSICPRDKYIYIQRWCL